MKIFENIDCMIGMEKYKDVLLSHKTLAIVDPEYGWDGKQSINFRFDKVYQNIRPHKDYFEELFLVSKNQIVWGGNYFTDMLWVNRCWIAWYKGQPIESFSDFELAWTSYDQTSRMIFLESYGFNHADKRNYGAGTIHPTQKPIALYKWLLEKYGKGHDLILDTHVGSASSLIACEEMGFDYIGFELDKDYYEAATKRIENYRKQEKLFKPEKKEIIQEKLAV